MTPYYQNESVTLYHGNCLEIIPKLDGLFNLLLTDPPYSRIKDDTWDRCSHSELETLLRHVFQILAPHMTINSAVYCFCWPYFSARLQMLMADYFNVLNEIVWIKRRSSGAHCGYHAKASLKALRRYFPETERIVFAEMRGSDKQNADAGYHQASEELFAEVMRPLIEYFANAKKTDGLGSNEIQNRMHALTGKRYTFARHSFGTSQWELPTKEQYEAAQTFMPSLRREYESLRREYESLRREYSPQRHCFTDVWCYTPLLAGVKDRVHNCQKPLAMIEDMITTSSHPGDLVIDPFAGSGTTGVAAMHTGRRAILIEQDEKHCEAAAHRLQSEISF